jgi:hypothetical protein
MVDPLPFGSKVIHFFFCDQQVHYPFSSTGVSVFATVKSLSFVRKKVKSVSVHDQQVYYPFPSTGVSVFATVKSLSFVRKKAKSGSAHDQQVRGS